MDTGLPAPPVTCTVTMKMAQWSTIGENDGYRVVMSVQLSVYL